MLPIEGLGRILVEDALEHPEVGDVHILGKTLEDAGAVHLVEDQCGRVVGVGNLEVEAAIVRGLWVFQIDMRRAFRLAPRGGVEGYSGVTPHSAAYVLFEARGNLGAAAAAGALEDMLAAE